MGKSSFFTGQPVFNQVLSLIERSDISELVCQYDADRYCKRFRTYDHLVTLLYSTLNRCNSLREVVTGLQASAHRLRHLGLKSTPRRSTLSDANARRPVAFFADLYHRLYQKYYGSLPDSRQIKSITDRLYIVDSTVVSVFSSVLQSSGCCGANGKKKGGMKAHVLLRAQDDVPSLINITEGKKGDATFLPTIQLPQGSIIVFDKGYRNYKQFARWTKRGITWVTRLHGKNVYKATSEREVTEDDKQTGVEADLEINLGNPRTSYINPIQKARLVKFKDPQTGKELEFLTNDFSFSPATIAEIYKRRWQIELLFKRIKQNFQVHFFLGDNENALKIQLWCTFIADLLLKIIKDRVATKRKWSMANLAGFVRLHLGTYISLRNFLCNPEKALLTYQSPDTQTQLQLFTQSTRGA